MTLVQKINVNDWNGKIRATNAADLAADFTQSPYALDASSTQNAVVQIPKKIDAVDALALCMQSGCSGF